MRFLIYGAGAIGQAISCLLASKGHHVCLILRERFIEPIRAEGLGVTGIFGEFHVDGSSLDLYSTIGEIQDNHFDYILLTTKSYGTSEAVSDIDRLDTGTSTIVSMQNGCGNVEQLISRFGKERSLGARVITGFEIEHPGLVRITVSADDVHIGRATPGGITRSAQLLADTINQAGLPCIGVEDINQSLFAKLLYNCALNPLGALLGVNYGVLPEHDDTRAIMNRVIEETFNVISALGGTIPWDNSDQFQEHFYGVLLPATYDHRSSMLQDLENRKQTEIDAFTGYVAQQGKLNGVTTPACELLTSLIRFKEQQFS